MKRMTSTYDVLEQNKIIDKMINQNKTVKITQFCLIIYSLINLDFKLYHSL